MVLKNEINKIELIKKDNYIFFYNFCCNKLIKNGKNSNIILINVFKFLKKKENNFSPLELFLKAIFNITPLLNIKKCPTKKKSLIIPRMNLEGFYSLGIQNLVKSVSIKNKKISIEEALADEIIKASKQKGIAYNKKIDLYRIVLENRTNTKFL